MERLFLEIAVNLEFGFDRRISIFDAGPSIDLRKMDARRGRRLAAFEREQEREGEGNVAIAVDQLSVGSAEREDGGQLGDIALHIVCTKQRGCQIVRAYDRGRSSYAELAMPLRGTSSSP